MFNSIQKKVHNTTKRCTFVTSMLLQKYFESTLM